MIVAAAFAPGTVRGRVVGLPALSQDEVEIVRSVDGVINVGRRRQDHLAIGQHLCECVLIGAALETELQHGVADDLWRPLVVRQHDRFV